MAAINLDAITENAARFGMRLQETFSEHTRDLSIARASSSTYFDNPEEKLRNIRKQLDSNSDREKMEAMKRLIALISRGRNVSEFFAQVVKNVASHNLEIRKLVYIYLLRYAEQEPDLALLSINTFQKDLTDPNPLIRSMALRVLSGIKVPMIGSIVVLAIKKCAADISPYVRKAAALAIPKCYNLDPNHQPELINIISTLLRDRSPLSVGSVAIAFEVVCPTRLDLLHPHYRRLCRTLIDADEWGQVDLLNLLIRYARTMLPRPMVNTTPGGEEQIEIDEDLKLLLNSSTPLLQSQNPAVVLAAARTLYYLGPSTDMHKAIPSLLRLLHVSAEVERIVLANLVVLSRTLANVLVPFYTRFLIRAGDFRPVKKDKIRLLRAMITVENHQALLREFINYAEDSDDELVSNAIEAIGHCARLVPDSTQQCLTALMSFIQSRHDVVVASAVLVLKSLVQVRTSQDSNPLARINQLDTSYSPLVIISRLAYKLDEIRHPKARACVIWLVGQYASNDTLQENGAYSAAPEGMHNWAPDVLRRSAKSFASEASIVKLQTLTLAAKLLVLSPAHRTIGLLVQYVFSLARYDLDFDVRDRARMLGSLLSGIQSVIQQHTDEDPEEQSGGVVLRREQVKMVLFEGKRDIPEDPAHINDEHIFFGSLSAVTGKEPSYTYLPDWLEKGIESSLRDTEDDIPQAFVSAPTGPRVVGSSAKATPVVLSPLNGPSPSGSYVRQEDGKATWTDLDQFYADINDESAESESEESEESSGEEDDEATTEEAEASDDEEDEEGEEGGEDRDRLRNT